MKYKFYFIKFVLVVFLPILAYSFEFSNPITKIPLQLEVEYSVIPISGVKLIYLALVDNIAFCDIVCFPQGFHIALAKSDTSNYFIGGFDFFAKITGGNFWQRWGLGLSFFDRQTEELQTPWDIHASMQSGWKNFMCNFHHWSNGRGGAERLHLEQYWPDKNDGANAVTCGAIIRF